jgi:hypothetical protein
MDTGEKTGSYKEGTWPGELGRHRVGVRYIHLHVKLEVDAEMYLRTNMRSEDADGVMKKMLRLWLNLM